MSYINKEDLLRGIFDESNSLYFNSPSAREAFSEKVDYAVDRIQDAPEVDAVEVVRCRNCWRSRPLDREEARHFEIGCRVCTSPHGAGVAHEEVSGFGRVVFGSDYCSYAINARR